MARARREPSAPDCDAMRELEALRLEKARREQVVAATLAAEWTLDLERGVLQIGPGWSRALGWSAEDLGTDARRIRNLVILEEDRATHARAIERHLAGSADRYDVELRLRRKDGAVVWAHDRGQVTRRARDGRALEMAGAWIDVTAKKASEAAQRDDAAGARVSDRRFQDAIDALPDGFLLFDAEDRLVAWNRVLEEMFPVLVEGLQVGTPYADILRLSLKNGEFASAPEAVERAAGEILAARARGDSEREFEPNDGRVVRAVDRVLGDGGRVGTRVDVTAFRHAQRKLARIVNATHAGAWEYDVSSDRVVFGESWLRDYGYAPGELGLTATEVCARLLHPEDLEANRRAFDAHLRGEAARYEAETRIRRKDGTWSWILASGEASERDAAGRATRVVGTYVDIDARKRAELEATAAQAKATAAHDQLVAALDALPDGMLIFDADDRITLFNRRISEMYPWIRGLPPGRATYEDLVRGGLDRGMIQPALGREEAWLAEWLAARRESPLFLRELRQSDGRWYRILDRRLADGGRIGLRIDVTELRRRADLLESIIEAAGLATWDYDFVTDRAVHNDRWTALLGYPARTEVAPSFGELLELAHPEDAPRLKADLEAPLRGGASSVESDFRVRRADGTYLWIQMRGRIVERGASGEPLRSMGVVVDVSAAKAAEEALSLASEAKSRFLATVTHEIRTPMQGVLGMAELLEATLVEPEQKRMLATMRESGNLLLAVVNDVLDLARIDAGGLELETVAYSPAALLRQVADAHRPSAAARHLDLCMSAAADAEPMRQGDPHRILQVLHNVVGNAVKFTEHGQIALSAADDGEGRVVFEVRDTGVGMTEAQLRRLFEPFSQAERSTARRFGGTGLGMSIVGRLVACMNGTIRVESRPGAGTCVRVALAAPRTAPVDAAPSPEPEAPSSRSLRILAVDDVATNRIVLEGLLRGLGHGAESAEGGADALDRLHRARFDLVLLDVEMPGLDGHATLAAIREAERAGSLPRVPVVAATARAIGGDEARFLAAGFDGYLAKPATRAKLKACLAGFM